MRSPCRLRRRHPLWEAEVPLRRLRGRLRPLSELKEVLPVFFSFIFSVFGVFLQYAIQKRISQQDITGKNKYRYYKVLLNDKNLNSDTFYSLPNKIPLMYTDDVHIHMAEGNFDILSIKENLPIHNNHDLYFASCGFGGTVIIKYLLHHGINTGIHFHIYSDNDKTDYDHKRYLFNKQHYTEWIDRIYLHRNQFLGEKDYGVPSSNIIDRYKMLK